MQPLPITAVIITKNEIAHIERVISSVLPLCAEVLVADSGSQDGTAQKAKEMGAKVLNMPWQGYAKTKNAATALAKYPWILSLDADEALSPTLLKEIYNAMQEPKSYVYGFNRLNHFGEKPIYRGGWNPDWQWRLYHKDHAQWNEDLIVHEQLSIGHLVRPYTFKNRLLHYTTPNYITYLNKQKKYANLHFVKNGSKPKPLLAYASACYRFFKELCLQGGFLDGKEGYLIAKAHFYYTVWKKAGK